jgi:hypothetical protein
MIPLETCFVYKYITIVRCVLFRKRKAEERSNEQQKAKVQKEWDKNYEVRLTIVFLKV